MDFLNDPRFGATSLIAVYYSSDLGLHVSSPGGARVSNIIEVS